MICRLQSNFIKGIHRPASCTRVEIRFLFMYGPYLSLRGRYSEILTKKQKYLRICNFDYVVSNHGNKQMFILAFISKNYQKHDYIVWQQKRITRVTRKLAENEQDSCYHLVVNNLKTKIFKKDVEILPRIKNDKLRITTIIV